LNKKDISCYIYRVEEINVNRSKTTKDTNLKKGSSNIIENPFLASYRFL